MAPAVKNVVVRENEKSTSIEENDDENEKSVEDVDEDVDDLFEGLAGKRGKKQFFEYTSLLQTTII